MVYAFPAYSKARDRNSFSKDLNIHFRIGLKHVSDQKRFHKKRKNWRYSKLKMSNKPSCSHRSKTNETEDHDQTEENILQILVAADINLGYEQTIDRDQEDDSFRTFQEILSYARDYEVDAILLGGNLFYESNPPINVIMRCISLLREYCLSQKSVKIDCITDPEWIFSHCPHKIVNFKDPNLNIGMPIFSIYGHRDSPLFGPVGALDLLAATGLINYFGKWLDDSLISIPPLLLRKGLTTLALYGLNYMNNEKLSKLMKRDKFELLQDESLTDVCNVMILHQKRAQRGRTENMFVSESLLPDFLNLVIWGHEPVCRIEHEPFPNKTFRVSQPGSCIATSLTRGETMPKQVTILKVYKNGFKMKYLKLKTVRPFIFDRLLLSEHDNEIVNLQHQRGRFGRFILKSRTEAVEEFVDNYIQNTLLHKAEKLYTGHLKQPRKPLLRLKIIFNQDQDHFILSRLITKYQAEVANPQDMIVFLKDTETDDDDDEDDYEELSAFLFEDETQEWTRTVEGGMSEYFSRDENRRKLSVLSLGKLNKALVRFRNGDNQAFHRTVKTEMQELIDRLIMEDIEIEDISEAIENYRHGT